MDHPKLVLACLFILALACGGLANVHHVNAWEKANGYPYGKMCNSIFTAYVDTCKH